jgi:hypothetical protein
LRLQGIAIHFNKTQPPSAYFQVLYARLIGRLTYLAIRQQCANWVNSSTIALTVALNNPNIQNAENYRSTFLRLVAEPENGSMLYTEKLWLDNVRAPNIEDVMDFYNECIESREQNWGDFFTKLQNILLVRPLWQ